MNSLLNGGFKPPRNGIALIVLIIARISTVFQDKRSLDDQIALCKRYVSDRYAYPVTYRIIQGQGSGEFLDRQDLRDAEAAVESRELDLVVVEDIGRICRRNRAVDFCEACEDADTRLVSINDNIDTANDGWRLNAFFATFKHESGNKDTAKRMRRSLRNRFMQGTLLKTFPAGYVVPPGAKSDADVFKAPGADEVAEGVARMFEADAGYEEVAEWLNKVKFALSRWCRRTEWYGDLVKSWIYNPILKGERQWNYEISRRVNKTGRRKKEKAPPEENLFRLVPHLAFYTPDRHDRLVAMLDRRAERNRASRAAKAAGKGPGASATDRRGVWPGQHAACGVCGHSLVWGAHGPADLMMCSGARSLSCWNAFSFNGRDAAPRLIAAFWQNLEGLTAFDRTLVTATRAAIKERCSSREERLRGLDGQIKQIDRQLDNVVNSIAELGNNTKLRTKLNELEMTMQQLHGERYAVTLETETDVELPHPDEIRRRAREKLVESDFGDRALRRLLKALMPTIWVYPVRALDGGEVYQRAQVEVLLVPLVGPGAESLATVLRRSFVVDLFDSPQRVAHREVIMRRIAEGGQHRQIAAELGIDQAAVQKSRALSRLMAEAGTSDPLQILKEPPTGTKLKRNQNKNYKFRPLPGFPAWPE